MSSNKAVGTGVNSYGRTSLKFTSLELAWSPITHENIYWVSQSSFGPIGIPFIAIAMVLTSFIMGSQKPACSRFYKWTGHCQYWLLDLHWSVKVQENHQPHWPIHLDESQASERGLTSSTFHQAFSVLTVMFHSSMCFLLLSVCLPHDICFTSKLW